MQGQLVSEVANFTMEENFTQFLNLLRDWTTSVDQDNDSAETYNQLLLFLSEFDNVSRKSLMMSKSLEKEVIRNRYKYIETGRKITALRNRLHCLTLRYMKAKTYRGHQVQTSLTGIIVVSTSPYVLKQKIEGLTQTIRDLESKQRMLMIRIAHIEKQTIIMQRLTAESCKILQEIPLD